MKVNLKTVLSLYKFVLDFHPYTYRQIQQGVNKTEKELTINKEIEFQELSLNREYSHILDLRKKITNRNAKQ